MQSAPLGAQCATHLDAAAAFVCTRCGTFACAPCGVDDQGRCSRCAVPSGFPFDATASVDQLFLYSWSALRRELPMLVVATLIALFTMVVGYVTGTIASVLFSFVLSADSFGNSEGMRLQRLVFGVGLPQLVQGLIAVPTTAFATLGLSRVAIDALEGRRVEVARMFRVGHAFPQFAVVRLFIFFVTTVPSVLTSIVSVYLASKPEGFGSAAAMGALDLFSWSLVRVVPITLVVLSLPFQFFPGPESLVSGAGFAELLQRAWSLVAGQLLRLLGYSMLYVVLLVSGLLGFGVGILVSIPLAWLVMTALFLSLRRTAGWPVTSR